MTNEQLVELAKEARKNACVDISNFKVGAALLDKNGNVTLGCNIEDPSGIGITNICAERCAVVKAISEGNRDFVKIAVVGGPAAADITDTTDTGNGQDELIFCTPCGACRQYLNSWNPKLKVVLPDENGIIKEYDLSELLPYSFNEKF